MKKFLFAITVSLVFATSAIQGQLLRRQIPVTQYYEENDLHVTFARGIPKSTTAAFARYLRSHLSGFELLGFDIFAMPGSTEQFFVTVPVYDRDTSILLLLRKHGADITEAGQFEKEGPVVHPYFFIGSDRVLLIVWNMAGDGGFYGNWAFEYRNEKLKALGEIDVIDQVPSELIYNRSPIETAMVDYKRDTYYITMRGRGNLYSRGNNDRSLARRGVPLTYVYKQGAWVPAGTRK